MRTPTTRASATATTSPRADSEGVLRARLGDDIALQTLAYGEAIEHHGVRVSLHPAGHVLGSAQVRLEHGGRVWVASGDYFAERRRRARTTPPARRSSRCAATASSPSRPSACRSTAGAPQARGVRRDRRLVARQRRSRPRQPAAGLQLRQGAAHPGRRRRGDRADRRARRGRAAERAPTAPPASRCRRRCASTEVADKAAAQARARRRAAVGAGQSPWMRRFGDYSDAFASGWMQLRGARRRRGVDRGFVLSATTPTGRACSARSRATGAERVIVTHGYEAVMVRWLQRAGAAGERLRDRVRRRARRRAERSAEPRRDGRGEAPHEALRRALRRARCSTATSAKVDALKRYFAAAPRRRRGVGGVLPRRRQAAPGGADRRAAARSPAQRAGIDDWLFDECYQAVGDLAETIAHVLPPAAQRERRRARRVGRGAPAAAARAARPSEQARARRRVLGRARRAGPLPAHQADRRRLSRRRQQAAGAARARRARRRSMPSCVAQRMMGYTDAPRAPDAPSATGAADAPRRRRPRRRAASRIRSSSRIRSTRRSTSSTRGSARPPTGSSNGSTTASARRWSSARGAGVDLVARRGAGDRALSRDRRAARGAARRHRARRRDRRLEGRAARAVRRCCSSASAARR